MRIDAKYPGCPETQTCRKKISDKAAVVMPLSKEDITAKQLSEAQWSPLVTPTSSGGPRHRWAPCKHCCCCAGGSSCCRSGAESFSSSPPESVAFRARPWTEAVLFFSSPHLDRFKFGGLAQGIATTDGYITTEWHTG